MPLYRFQTAKYAEYMHKYAEECKQKMQKIGTNVLKICIKNEQTICTKYAITQTSTKYAENMQEIG